MKNKKKLIITLVSVFSVILIGIIAFVVVSNLTTSTVNDLRILELSTNTELSEKEVYLTQKDSNYFDIKLKTFATSTTNYVVYSSNPSVASVKATSKGYRVTYHKAGKANITATTYEASNIKDSFSLRVMEFVPTEFTITDDKAISGSEIEIFADNLEYRFDFDVFQGNIKENMNMSSIAVLDNYDKSIINTAYIDDVNGQLVIKANQSESARKEIITIVSKQSDQDGNKTTVSSFTILVNIKGYYIKNIQLMLSSTPNFEQSKYIYGEGLLNEGEEMVDTVYLTEVVNTVYAKVRKVYTNGYMEDVTSKATSDGNPENISRVLKSNYFSISVKAKNGSLSTQKINFSCAGKEDGVTLNFVYLAVGSEMYDGFYNNIIYTPVLNNETHNIQYYNYTYWDNRFMRYDTVTDEYGRVIKFINGEYNTYLGDD